MFLRVILISLLLSSSTVFAKANEVVVKEEDEKNHYICLGVDSNDVAYELDFFLEDKEALQGVWKGVNDFHFVGNGLKADDDEYIFYFSSKNPEEPIDGIQYYTAVGKNYLFGKWTAWNRGEENEGAIRITGHETCLRV